MKIERIGANTVPLCFLPSGNMVCYHVGKLMIFSGKRVVKSFRLFFSWKEIILGRSLIMCRLLRLGIHTAIPLDEEHVLLSKGNRIYECDLSVGGCSDGYFCGKGVRPLAFSDVKNISGFDDGIYFGTYQSVFSENPVMVFRRVGIDKWEKVFSFETGTVEHIHNIVPDRYRNCLWVFSGDFDDNAAIWRVSEKFTRVERKFYGKQKFRACVAFVCPEGLLYAMDSPIEKDYILFLNPETGELKEVSSISGSCIYGCRWKDKFVFESSVEPLGKYKNIFHYLLCRGIGSGIQDRFVRIYCGNLEEGFSEIYREEKDELPYATFQFGVVKFPTGKNNGERLFFQPVSVKKGDLQLHSLEL